MSNKIQLNGIRLDPTTADGIASNLNFEADVKNLSIDEITGNTKLKGTMQNGVLHIDFSTVFDWGWGKKSKLNEDESVEEFKQKLINAGLDNAQADSVMQLIETEITNISEKTTGEIDYHEDSKKGLIGGNEQIIEAQNGGIDFHLFPVPINADIDIDAKNISVDSLTLSADTQLIADNFQTNTSQIDDVELDSEVSLPFENLELDKTAIGPVNVPRLDIPDISSSFTVEKVTSPKLSLELDTKSGSSDINLTKLVDWHPRWSVNIGFKFIVWYIGIWITFGINLTINLKFKLLIESLKISMTLSKLVLQGLSFSLKLIKTSIVNTKLGILNIAKVLVSKINPSK